MRGMRINRNLASDGKELNIVLDGRINWTAHITIIAWRDYKVLTARIDYYTIEAT